MARAFRAGAVGPARTGGCRRPGSARFGVCRSSAGLHILVIAGPAPTLRRPSRLLGEERRSMRDHRAKTARPSQSRGSAQLVSRGVRVMSKRGFLAIATVVVGGAGLVACVLNGPAVAQPPAGMAHVEMGLRSFSPKT